ncbi:NirD/YgiW/YdeI family stress tolerance protein [Photobacterium leiognathi]|uniref:YgiW/YdeI family stress tolerance OB fold protein n=1 Tax=Photobacterium leiognathi TaxID=553611 RepID=UPI001EE0B195|nr:NirD/YgiW/YdeI family stress tolerance protein [Photobacterium leiognathi]MCG3885601.1 NirD/YgiW/YdeI family stress tolerance protein [Photobacterium leiognathi]
MSIKRTSLFLLPVALLSTPVLAEASTQGFVLSKAAQTQQQGFNGPTYGLKTVKEVLDAGMFSDDTSVTLSGHISYSLGGENYTFTDGTGSITIEIEHDKWFGAQVTPETKITIQGEIDKEFNHTSIDVDYVRVVS